MLLYSFYKYNPAFSGEVVIISDDLPEKYRERIARFGAIRFEPPDPQLRAAVDDLQATEPKLKDIYRRLFSFEVFRLSAYRRVVYIDSDIYCSGDISELFTRTEPLLACPDGFTYEDRVRSLLANGVPPARSERYGKRFDNSFNTGVLSIGESLLGEETYHALLGMLDPASWRRLGPSKFTDQMALNVHFDGRYTSLSARYNYVVFLEEYQKCLERVSLLDARLVHFAGVIKPWNCYDPVELARSAPQFIKFIDVWRELLDEARSGTDCPAARADVERRFRRQSNWIAVHNEKGIQPIGRLY